jgi:hypothetical protein
MITTTTYSHDGRHIYAGHLNDSNDGRHIYAGRLNDSNDGRHNDTGYFPLNNVNILTGNYPFLTIPIYLN